MSKPTKYGLNKYIKAIEILTVRKGFFKVSYWPNKGSKYTFHLYQQQADQAPCAMWGVHFEHSKKKEIHPRDFKKAWTYLGVTEQEFLDVIDTL